MSAPRIIAEMVVTGIRVLGKATAAAGSQAVKNFKHKPEGAPASGPAGTGSSKSKITNQMQMSLDEAHLILNVKKEDPLEIIEKNFERIFKSNGPPAETTPAAAPAQGSRPAQPQSAAARKSKAPTHSHYLQSKVYRALERIKAEREADVPTPPEGGAGATAAGEGGAAATSAAAPGATPGGAPGSGSS